MKVIRKNKLEFIVFSLVMAILLSSNVIAPPTPHNVEGQVFTDNTMLEGVRANLPVRINDTLTNNIVIVYTEDPGPPQLKGIYSAVISGNTNDFIVVTSWNASHFAISNASLASTTTTVVLAFNRTRQSEANVTILLPPNNSLWNTSVSFNLTANISIIGNDGTNCNSTVYFSNGKTNITNDQNFTNQLGNIPLNSHKTTTWNISGLKEGILNITVTGQCPSDGTTLEKLNTYTILLRINDTTIPIVNLLSPSNNSYVNGSQTFIFNVTENNGIKNCSFFFDNKFNQSHGGIDPNTIANFTLNGTPEGKHNWSVICYDNSTNRNYGNSTVFFLTVDSSAPSITLFTPFNSSTLENYNVSFSYNVTDNFNVSNCSLILNNQIRITNFSVVMNMTNYFNLSVPGKDYNWSISCTDLAGNLNQSLTYTILVPDLKINLSDIFFSKDFPAENELIYINATVRNIGSGNQTRNSTVRFYTNNPDINGIQIGPNFSVNVTSGYSVNVTINYTPETGRNNIFVVIDPNASINGSLVESNETNNIANRTLFITAYNIYYGGVFAELVLDTSDNLSILSWYNLSSFNGNIFAADSDSIPDFFSLIALGRNRSSNFSMEDFEEIDIALNFSNSSDSINSTWTFRNLTKAVSNFTSFDRLIQDVPVVNSTNTSSFITGILWDTSDPNNGTFNGSQDIAFVTKVSKKSQGYYGTYDYEIKVPANLERYLKPNEQDSISFYREIT